MRQLPHLSLLTIGLLLWLQWLSIDSPGTYYLLRHYLAMYMPSIWSVSTHISSFVLGGLTTLGIIGFTIFIWIQNHFGTGAPPYASRSIASSGGTSDTASTSRPKKKRSLFSNPDDDDRSRSKGYNETPGPSEELSSIRQKGWLRLSLNILNERDPVFSLIPFDTPNYLIPSMYQQGGLRDGTVGTNGEQSESVAHWELNKSIFSTLHLKM